MSLRPPLILLALLLAAPLARGAAAGVRFVLTGTVTEPGGRPVRGARVELEGVPDAAAVTDAAGGYALAHDLPAMSAEPARLVLRVRHRGWRLALPSGETSLAVELRRIAAGDSARFEVRANDAATAKAVARALAAGAEATVALEARFTRLVGREDHAAAVLTALEVVPLAAPVPGAAPTAAALEAAGAPRERPASLRLFPGAPDPADSVASVAPAPVSVAAPAPAAAPSVRSAAPAVADTALRPGIRVSLRTDPAAAVPAAADTLVTRGANPLRVVLGRAVPEPGGRAGDCGCRVSGTVEVRSERTVRGRPRVVVSLAGRPAPRDTVTLFMGPPRPFDLGRVPCGRHELELRVLGSRLRRVAPDSLGFTCGAAAAPQFRVVLEPR